MENQQYCPTRPYFLSLFTEVRGETVWKIAEGFLAVRFWRQEAADLVLFASVGGLRSPELGLIPIFQTVSPRRSVNKDLGRYAQVARRVAACSVAYHLMYTLYTLGTLLALVSAGA